MWQWLCSDNLKSDTANVTVLLLCCHHPSGWESTSHSTTKYKLVFLADSSMCTWALRQLCLYIILCILTPTLHLSGLMILLMVCEPLLASVKDNLENQTDHLKLWNKYSYLHWEVVKHLEINTVQWHFVNAEQTNWSTIFFLLFLCESLLSLPPSFISSVLSFFLCCRLLLPFS